MDYTPEPIDTSKVKLPTQLDELLEILAKNTHDLWAKQRIEEGWSHGPKRSDNTHPGLVPYDELPEEEKNYDRTTATEALKTIVALGYQLTPPWHGNAGAMQFKVAVAE
ncbi:MAG: hypothetical protein IH991_14280, partial [Planctomycetes bacterium]|nr:hypothetical protein [Planctomycetota bacterium]